MAEKYMNKGESRSEAYPNICAFRVSEETKKHIEDVFNALYMTWQYMPDDNQWKEYIRSINKNYGYEYGKICDIARKLNSRCFERNANKKSKLMAQFLNSCFPHGIYMVQEIWETRCIRHCLNTK